MNQTSGIVPWPQSLFQRIKRQRGTLGTMGVYRSLVTWLADGGTLTLNFTVGGLYSELYYGCLLGLPHAVWIFLATAIAGYVLLNHTVLVGIVWPQVQTTR